MNNSRKLMVGLLLSLVVLILAACGGSGDDTEQEVSADESGSGDEQFTLIMSHELATSHVKHEKMEEFAEVIETESDGRINVELYPSGQLYNDTEAIDAIGTGSVHMAWPPTALLERVNEEMGVVGLPFALDEQLLLESTDYKNDLNELLSGFLADKNMLHLGVLRATGGVLISKDKRIQEIADLEGLDLNISGSQTQINIMQNVGSNPIAMPITEAPTALAQGTIDSVQTSPSVWATGIGEIAEYGAIIEGIVPMTNSIILDEAWYNELPEDLQQLILDATNNSTNEFAQATIDADAEMLEEVSSFATIDEFDEGQLAELREMVQPTIDDFNSRFPDAYSKYSEIVEKYSAE